MTLAALAFVFFAFILPVAVAWYSLLMIHRYRQLPPRVQRYLEASVDVPTGGGHLLLGAGVGFILADMMGAPLMWIVYCAWGVVCHSAIGPIYRLEAWEKAQALSEGIPAQGELPEFAPAPTAPLGGRSAIPEERP